MLLSLPAVVVFLAVATCLAARYLANSRDKRRMDLFAVGMGIGGAPWIRRGWASGSLLAKTDSVSWSRAPADWLTLVDKNKTTPGNQGIEQMLCFTQPEGWKQTLIGQNNCDVKSCFILEKQHNPRMVLHSVAYDPPGYPLGIHRRLDVIQLVTHHLCTFRQTWWEWRISVSLTSLEMLRSSDLSRLRRTKLDPPNIHEGTTNRGETN
jgi:hypothetical protein